MAIGFWESLSTGTRWPDNVTIRKLIRNLDGRSFYCLQGRFSKNQQRTIDANQSKIRDSWSDFPLLPDRPGKAVTTGLAFDADVALSAAVFDKTNARIPNQQEPFQSERSSRILRYHYNEKTHSNNGSKISKYSLSTKVSSSSLFKKH